MPAWQGEKRALPNWLGVRIEKVEIDLGEERRNCVKSFGPFGLVDLKTLKYLQVFLSFFSVLQCNQDGSSIL